MASYQTYTDEALLILLHDGDERAFSAVYERYKEKVYAYAFKWAKTTATAEEITQDTFVSLWINREKLPDVKNAAAYIFRMAANKTYDYLRSAKARERLMTEVQRQQAGPLLAESGEDVYLTKETEQLIWQAVGKLSPQKQRIYRLNMIEAKTPNEIAKELHISPSTVRSHLADAIQHVQASLRGITLALLFVLVHYFK